MGSTIPFGVKFLTLPVHSLYAIASNIASTGSTVETGKEQKLYLSTFSTFNVKQFLRLGFDGFGEDVTGNGSHNGDQPTLLQIVFLLAQNV